MKIKIVHRIQYVRGQIAVSQLAERQFRKVQGYREIPSLLTSLANTASKKAVAEEVKVA
jgi:hypothetical protein